MKNVLKLGVAAAALVGLGAFSATPARADHFGLSIGIGGGVGFVYSSGGYCDRWGCPGDFWDYPIFYCPVFFDGYWYRGPVYYRIWYGEPFFWVHGGWHRDEWDEDYRPSWACIDRFGPPRDYDWYIDNGFYWPDYFVYRYYIEYRDFYPGYDYYWWRHHHRDWDSSHNFDHWRADRHESWWASHGFDRDWKQEHGGQFWTGGHGWPSGGHEHHNDWRNGPNAFWTGSGRDRHDHGNDHGQQGSNSFGQGNGDGRHEDRHPDHHNQGPTSGDSFGQGSGGGSHEDRHSDHHDHGQSGGDWFGQANGPHEEHHHHDDQAPSGGNASTPDSQGVPHEHHDHHVDQPSGAGPSGGGPSGAPSHDWSGGPRDFSAHSDNAPSGGGGGGGGGGNGDHGDNGHNRGDHGDHSDHGHHGPDQ